MAAFGRVLTAMITPFREDGEVDHERTWNLARRFLASNGSDGLVSPARRASRRRWPRTRRSLLYRTVVEAVAGQDVKVVAGTGTYNTAESVHLSRRAAEAGCDGILAVTPYYNRPSQEGLIAHFRAIADATDLPVMLYNIPGRTARLIEVETLQKLVRPPPHRGRQGRGDGHRLHVADLCRSARSRGVLGSGLLHVADDGGGSGRRGLGDLPSGGRGRGGDGRGRRPG